jgi:peptide-methionine (S)-S-oxide reductase
VLKDAGYEDITTEIEPEQSFYFAEDYHQQYLAKNPNGYRCHSATGLRFPQPA